MHPFIQEYLRTVDDPAVILKRITADDPITNAFRKLHDAFAGRHSLQQALDQARDIPFAGQDPDLMAMFLIYQAAFDLRYGSGEAAPHLHRLAGSLLTRKTPPEIRARLELEKAEFLFEQGNGQEAISRMSRVISGIPGFSPRRVAIVGGACTYFSLLGRLSELEKEVAWARRQATSRWLERIELWSAFDDVETGRWQAARDRLSRLEAGKAADFGPLNSRTLSILQGTLSLVRWREEAPRGREGPAKGPDEFQEIQVLRLLLERRPDEALSLARSCEEKAPSFAKAGLLSFTLVRAELANRNGEAARRILEKRMSLGNRSFLDDFFLARIEILAGDPEAARNRYNAAIETAAETGAQGRIDFELDLACELTARDAARMARPAPARAARKPEPSLPSAPSGSLSALVGASAAIRTTRRNIERFAPLDVPVLVTGPTGVGKELIARALHELSPRRKHPFLAVNCAALSEALLQSELFGHAKGAFTGAESARAGLFEEAGEGTLFLDEIGDMQVPLQASLLRVLEAREVRPVGANRSHKVHCRVVAATNAPLEERVKSGWFREDLLFRLRRLEIRMPALRERPQDIVPLARYFLNLDRPDGTRATLTEELERLLTGKDWPGNVRELANAIERMRLLNSDKAHYDLPDLNLPDTDDPHRTRSAGGIHPPDVHRILQSGRSPIRRLDRLRELFRQHRKLTRPEVARIQEVSLPTAGADLRALREEGFIEKIEPSRSPRSHYFLLKQDRKTAPPPEQTGR